MKQGVPSSIANLALAVGVVFALAFAIGFALRHPRSSVQPAVQEDGTNRGVIYLRLPPARRPDPNLPKSRPPIPAKESAPLVPRVSASAQRAPGSGDVVAEPFEPPPPPIADAPSAEPLPAGRQVAALPPSGSAPSPPPPAPLTKVLTVPVPAAAPSPAPSARPPVTETAILVRPGDPLPRLRSVAVESHEVHRVPDSNFPMRPVTVVNRESGPSPIDRTDAPPRAEVRPPREARPLSDAVGRSQERIEPAETPDGPNLSGPAIVTAALELNIGGKALKLAGVKLPESTDMCAPNAKYAARVCADVTRQALGALIGTKGDVSCRILRGGRAAWPAVCKGPKGQDIAAYLIKHGFALADANDMVNYSAVETQAKSAHTGLWSYR